MATERGINRIVAAVWDLEQGMEFYSKLLQSQFVETTSEMGRSFGVRVAMNFEAGVELVSPLPGADNSVVRDHLEEHGEGISGVVFAVPDADKARDAAAELGWEPFFDLDLHQAEARDATEGNYDLYKEYFYQGKGSLPVTVLLGEFEAAPDGPLG